ncbi:MAG: glutathione S-transferase family protein [Alphaproteobacteria bacterium]
MIKLYQYPPSWGMNVSPFTLKLETWLKLSSLDYQAIAATNPGAAPKGKLPYIEDEDGTTVGDSSLIIDHLKRTRQIDPDHELTERQRAEAISLQRLFEDHFYFILVHSRWIDPVGWEIARPAFFSFLPAGIRDLAAAYVRRKVRRALHEQGLGRHSQNELYAMGRADLRAIAVLLGNRAYFFGDGPTTIDAVAYGFLANLLFAPVDTELKRIGLEYDNLRLYCERLAQGLGDPTGPAQTDDAKR